MRTHHEQHIEQVASIIYDSLSNGGEITDVQAVNEGDGFTVDLRYDDGGYVNDTDWTRIEGLTLGPRAWAAACVSAQQMLIQGGFPADMIQA